MRISTTSLVTVLAAAAVGVPSNGLVSANGVGDGEGRLRESHKRRELTSHRRRMEQNRRALLLDDYEVDTNMANLKRQYFDFHGKELTDEMIEAALEKAHADAGGKAFGPDRKIHMYGSVDDFDRESTPDNVVWMDEVDSEDHPDYQHRHLLTHRRTQVVRRQNMYIVAGNSPGWQNNRGRNEFFCVSLYSLDKQNYLPEMGEMVTLRNCYTTPGKAIALRYANDFSIRTLNDNIYYTWCVRVKKPNKNQEARIDTCNFFDPNEVWNLFVADRTWRPGENADLDLCMTSQNNPSDGGKLQLEICDEQYNFPNPNDRRRQRQLALPGPGGDAEEHDEEGAREEDDAVERMLGNRRRKRKRLARKNKRKNNKNNKKKNNSNNNEDDGQRWYQGSNALRMRQVWITCAETDTCNLNINGFLDCNLITACQPDGILP